MEKGTRLKNKRNELLFLISATTLTACLVAYLFWLVHLLANKADLAFKNTPNAPVGQLRFDFEKYNKILQTLNQKK